MSTSMWNKFFKKEKEIADSLAEEEKRAAMKRADEAFAKWLEKIPPGLMYTPTVSKAAPGWATSSSSPAGSILPPRPASAAKFDFAAWEFNVACIKLAEKLGFTTPAEIYAFIKEIERD